MGAVLHTLNPRLHPDELSFIVNDAEDRAIVVDESLLEVFERFREARDFEHVIVVARSGAVPDGYLDYEPLIGDAEPMHGPQADERAGRGHVLHVGHHRAAEGRGLLAPLAGPALAGGRAARRQAIVRRATRCCRWCRCSTPTPGGWPTPRRLVGAGLVLPGPKLDAVSVLDLLADEKVTISAGVPTVWMAVLQALDAEPDRWDLSALTHLLVGGSAAPKSLLEGLERHGLTIIHAWGMTETSPLGSVCRLPPATRRCIARGAATSTAAARGSRRRSWRSGPAATTAS